MLTFAFLFLFLTNNIHVYDVRWRDGSQNPDWDEGDIEDMMTFGLPTGSNMYNCTKGADCGCVPQMYPPCRHYSYISPDDPDLPSCHDVYVIQISLIALVLFNAYQYNPLKLCTLLHLLSMVQLLLPRGRGAYTAC